MAAAQTDDPCADCIATGSSSFDWPPDTTGPLTLDLSDNLLCSNTNGGSVTLVQTATADEAATLCGCPGAGASFLPLGTDGDCLW